MQVRPHIFALLLCVFAIASIAMAQNEIQAVPDTDLDGLSNDEETSVYGTDPFVADTDGDTMVDGVEVHIYNTNPRVADAQQSDPIVIPETNNGLTPVANFPDHWASTGVLSSNGQYIAFGDLQVTANNERSSLVSVYEVATGNLQTLPQAPGVNISTPKAISNDGRYVTIEGVGPRVDEACYSSAGDYITSFYVYDRQTGVINPIIEDTDTSVVRVTAFTRDGLTAIVNKMTMDPSIYVNCAPNTDPTYMLYAYDVVSNTLAQVPLPQFFDDKVFNSLSVSDNGQLIEITTFDYEIAKHDLYLLDRGSNIVTPISVSYDFDVIRDARISGDGSVVIISTSKYNGECCGGHGFYIYDVASGTGSYEPLPITEHTQYGGSVHLISADAKTIVLAEPFAVGIPQRNFPVIYNRENGSILPLVTSEDPNERINIHGISSDGSKMLYVIRSCIGGLDCYSDLSTENVSEAYIYDYSPPEIVETVPPGGMTTTAITQARGWSKLQWKPVDGAEWYHLWLGDYTDYTFDQWYEATDVCDGSICSTPEEFWLENDTYHWWMTHWSSSKPNYEDNYSETMFTINVDVPNRVNRLAQNAIASGNSNTALTWENDPKASWYHLHIGDGQTVTYDNWFQASQICDGSVCTAAINLPVGTHEWWMTSWGPGGYAPWNTEPLIVTVSG